MWDVAQSILLEGLLPRTTKGLDEEMPCFQIQIFYLDSRKTVVTLNSHSFKKVFVYLAHNGICFLRLTAYMLETYLTGNVKQRNRLECEGMELCSIL